MHFLSIFFHEKGNNKPLKKVKNRRKPLLLSFSKGEQWFLCCSATPSKKVLFLHVEPSKNV